MNVAKKKIKVQSHNTETGEMHETLVTQIEHVYRRPLNGYKGAYMKKLSEIVEVSKSAQRLFFAIVQNVNDYNKLITKWNTLSEEDAGNISKAKKELVENGFIAKIGKSWVLNPYVVLPRYQTKAPEYQGEIQQIWTRYNENLSEWYEGIDVDAQELYG